jgi:predicted Zn-dependent protease with MMP-like domain
MDEFEKYVDEAMKTLPKEFGDKLDNVSVFIEDFPTRAQVSKFESRNENFTLLGLYEGIPQTKRRGYGIGGAVPDKITLFRYPILSFARTREHLIEMIRDTLFHEIGHHFGMSEEDIRKAQVENRSNSI